MAVDFRFLNKFAKGDNVDTKLKAVEREHGVWAAVQVRRNDEETLREVNCILNAGLVASAAL